MHHRRTFLKHFYAVALLAGSCLAQSKAALSLSPERLTPDDVSFLRARRDEARQVLEYQADDSHLLIA